MRLGLFGARMDNTGLGYQTWAFYRHMKPAKTFVIDISVLERDPRRVMKQYPDRYENAMFGYGIPQESEIRDFLQDLDVVFVAESPYSYDLYRIARELGVKTACQYNYEFFDWFLYDHFPKPDMLIAPSKWHYDDIETWCQQQGVKHVYLHCPVDRSQIERRYIHHATKFLHIAGRPAANDRNGTYTFLEAAQLAGDTGMRFMVATQSVDLEATIRSEFPSVELITDISEHTDLYKKADVLVLPRRYGGNCLPLNEALAAGMPAIMPNISPNGDFLPHEWLTKASVVNTFTPRTVIDIYETPPHELLLKMAWFNSLSEPDMIKANDWANTLADRISWETMKPEYERVLADLCS